MMIHFVLNGQKTSLEADPVKPLLDVIRDDLGLTGTKQGCDHEGECGACTVLLNGKPIRSCLTPIAKVMDQEVLTIEGLGTRDHPHPLQKAFMESGAVQCGYCIPGMLLTGKSLLDENPTPSRQEIKQTLAGNICRCTGYSRIIQAIQIAATQIKRESHSQPSSNMSQGPILGRDPIRIDAWKRVSGQTQYVEDMNIPALHHLVVLRSPYHHARLLSIDQTQVRSIPGVVQVITADDIPGKNGLGDYSRDEPVLVPVGDTCKMMGAPIALVIADTKTIAEQALNSIMVNYQELPAVFSLAESESSPHPPIYKGGDILAEQEFLWGDLKKAFMIADQTLESQYHTSWQEHVALEREAVLGYYDEQNRLTVIGGTHEPHWQQSYIAACLDIPVNSVRVIMPPTGGSFGGRQDPWPFLAVALAVFHSQRAVRLSYSRSESLLTSPKRHPYQITINLGATKKGQFSGIDTDTRINTGGYDGHGRYIVDYALVGSGGPYRYQAARGRAKSIFTNGPKAGQFRGFGTPQTTFALECTIDELAQRLKMDPLELRLLNAINQNDRSFLGYPIQESLAYREVLDVIKPNYQAYLSEAESYNTRSGNSPFRKGVGISGMWYRFGKSGSLRVEAQAQLSDKGEIIIHCSAPDYGQGSTTAMSQMAAEVLSIQRDSIKIINADTARTPDSGIQGASRATYFVGGAVVKAAANLKDAILSTAAEILDCPPQSLVLNSSGVHCSKGTKQDSENPMVNYPKLAEEFRRLNIPTKYTGIFDLTNQFPLDTRPTYIPLFVTGAQAAEVIVNMETGQVKVVQITAVHDVGKVVNPLDARGQIEGSIMMGLGTALMEEYLPGITKGFGDYPVPTSEATPEIDIHLLEVPSYQGPFGVKGLGEAAILPTAPAIINAISRAINARIYELPATPEVVLQAMSFQKGIQS
jgi:CO/xanthine dehydrogenase Mo-binding subunit/aerobic-type carbon monoxide dehydrogenase small subunit (CoxS/CutS family)